MATKAKTTKNQFKSTNKFVNKALTHINKSEAQKQGEQIELFVKRSTIEVRQQISTRKSEISNLELDLQSANSTLEMANEALEVARFTPAANLEAYLDVKNSKQQEVHTAEIAVEEVEDEIASLNAEIAELEAVLADFQ